MVNNLFTPYKYVEDPRRSLKGGSWSKAGVGFCRSGPLVFERLEAPRAGSYPYSEQNELRLFCLCFSVAAIRTVVYFFVPLRNHNTVVLVPGIVHAFG